MGSADDEIADGVATMLTRGTLGDGEGGTGLWLRAGAGQIAGMGDNG